VSETQGHEKDLLYSVEETMPRLETSALLHYKPRMCRQGNPNSHVNIQDFISRREEVLSSCSHSFYFYNWKPVHRHAKMIH
jgi:hypothetical protein